MPRLPASFEGNTFIDQRIRRAEPGSIEPIFPRSLENAAIFTFAGRPQGLNWRLGSMRVAQATSGVGVATVADSVVPTTALRYYHAISAFHNDPTPRNMSIGIQDPSTGLVVQLVQQTAVTQLQSVAIDRPIVIGEEHVVRATLNAIAAGFEVFLLTYFDDQGLGAELPGL